MKNTIWLCCYLAAGVVALGFNYAQWLGIFKNPGMIVSMITMFVIALQLPLYFLFGRGR